MGKAITIGDRAHARLPAFQRRVALALDTIAEAANLGRIGVSFSGGKDSTVLLDLVRQVQPGCAAAFFDSGCEYPWTYELVEHYGVDVIKPERSLPEMCRYGGYWGYRGPDLVDLDAEFDFFAFLIGEPAYRFIHQWGLTTVAIGLRRQESAGRRISLFRHGTLHHMKGGWWHLCPLAGWRHEDIWAYIANRGLRYNEVYDRMAEFGIDREQWRVSTLLGASGSNCNARLAFIRAVAPDVFWRLAAEFPYIRGFA